MIFKCPEGEAILEYWKRHNRLVDRLIELRPQLAKTISDAYIEASRAGDSWEQLQRCNIIADLVSFHPLDGSAPLHIFPAWQRSLIDHINWKWTLKGEDKLE